MRCRDCRKAILSGFALQEICAEARNLRDFANKIQLDQTNPCFYLVSCVKIKHLSSSLLARYEVQLAAFPSFPRLLLCID